MFKNTKTKLAAALLAGAAVAGPVAFATTASAAPPPGPITVYCIDGRAHVLQPGPDQARALQIVTALHVCHL